MWRLYRALKKAVTYKSLPFGLPTKYGTLYGWTLHDWKYGYEPDTVAFFEQHLYTHDVVADIGASVGFLTILFSKLVKEVVAFEPSPEAFEYLQKATILKDNVTVYKIGVSDHVGEAILYASEPGSPLGSIKIQEGDVLSRIALIPLRDVLRDFTWAKIDVEGSEIEVLRGMEKPINCVVEAGGARPHFKEIEEMGYEIRPIVFGGDGQTVDWDGTNDLQAGNLWLRPKQNASN